MVFGFDHFNYRDNERQRERERERGPKAKGVWTLS